MMTKKPNSNLTSFADHLDSQYGKRGTENRERYETEFEAFKAGIFANRRNNLVTITD